MIVDVKTVKEQLGQTLDIDDALIERKIAAAQDHIESLLGFKIEEEYPPAGTPSVTTAPASLIECVCQLAAHWYENREASIAGVGMTTIPFGVADIVREHRRWSW